MRWWMRLMRKARAEKQLDAELRFHVEQQIADYIAQGMTREEARRRARMEFGGMDQVKEEVHEAHRGYFLETLLQDVRYGLRMLRKDLGFTIVAVLTLALGIGATMAVFSMIDTLILRPLPIHNPHAVTFLAFPRDATHFDPSFSVAEFHEVSEQTSAVFSETAAMIMGGFAGPTARADGLTADGITRPVQTLFVSGNFFQMLGIRPYLGRFILTSEGQVPGADPVAVLSYRYWRARFHGDRTILNKVALINGHAVTIVGIGPKGFLGPTPIVEMEAYLPLGMMTVETGGNGAFLTDPKTRDLLVVARLRHNVKIERANAALAAVGQRIGKEYQRTGVGTLQARFLKPPGLVDGPNPFPPLAALFLTLAGLVLALACINVANLSLVRAAGRQREMAVRAALGGSRSRLIRQLLSETILLGLAGAGAGMIAGTLALRAVSSVALVSASAFPVVFEFPFNGRVFIFAVAVAILAAAVAGIVPALRASSADLSDVLHEGGRTSTGRSQRTRTALVAAQVGGSLALLVVAGLFVRNLRGAQHEDLGFDAQDVLNVTLDPGEIGYTQAQGVEFYRQLLDRVRALPGVQWASVAMAVPLDNFSSDDITIPGYVPQRGEELHADYNAVSPDYFRTMKIEVLQGHSFSDSDAESSPRVALINEAMAERFWHGANPIGRSFKRNGDAQHALEVVGVVKNSRTEDTFSPYGPAFYVPLSQDYTSSETLQIRTAGPPQAIAPEVLAIVRGLAPTVPVLVVRTMADAVRNSPDGLLLFDLGAEITAALGLLGLTLAMIGVYGVMAYAVGRRTQEIGVRMALGAQRNNILWMICRQGVVIVGIGLALGIAAAMGVGRLVGDFLVGVAPTDPLTYSAVSLLLTCVALLACYVPVRRAMRVDPMVALRHE